MEQQEKNLLNRAKEYVVDNIIVLVIAAMCIVYILLGLVNIVETDNTVREIIANGAIAFIFGVVLNFLLKIQGLNKGENDIRTIATNNLHGEVVEKATKYIDKLDTFCDNETRDMTKTIQTRILARAGIKYSDFENGTINYDILSKDKLKLVESAKKVKITPLTTNSLTSINSQDSDPFRFKESKERYISRTSPLETILRAVFAFIIGYYTTSLIKDFSWSSLIWTFLQVTLFLGLGSITMYKAYFYVIDKIRGNTIKKINILNKFIILAEREEKEKEGGKDYGEQSTSSGTRGLIEEVL